MELKSTQRLQATARRPVWGTRHLVWAEQGLREFNPGGDFCKRGFPAPLENLDVVSWGGDNWMSRTITAHLPGQGAGSHAWPLGALVFAATVLYDTNLLTCVAVTGDEVASRRRTEWEGERPQTCLGRGQARWF